MKNSILKYDKISSKSFTSEDYTSKKYRKILEIPELNNTDYIEYIELIDDQKIEQISYTLYGTPDYWDLLVLINDRDPLFDMSYNFDIQEAIAEDIVQKYLSDYSGIYKGNTYTRMKEYVMYKIDKETEENRTLKIIKPSRIQEILKLINLLDI